MPRVSRRMVVAIALMLTLACGGGSAAAADYRVADAGSGRGDDTACLPCKTVQGAITKAGRDLNNDRILLGRGTYRERLLVRDPRKLALIGQGAATQLVGNVDIAPPNAADSYIGPSVQTGREVAFQNLALSAPAEAISATRVAVALTDAAIAGTVGVSTGGLAMMRSSISGSGCSAGLAIDQSGFADAAHPLEIAAMTYTTIIDSTVSGQPAISYQGSINVFDSAYIVRGLLSSGRAGCPPAQSSALEIAANAFAQISNSLILAESAAPGGSAVSITDSLAFISLDTIAGGYATGITSTRGRAIVQGTAIDGPAVAVDALTGFAELEYVYGSGSARIGAGVPGPLNRFGQPLLLRNAIPIAGSPLIGAIPADFDFDTVETAGLTVDFTGLARPRPTFLGGAPTYDVGAFEVPEVAPAVPLSPSFHGPIWLPGRVVDGVIDVDFGGIGFPAAPAAPLVGSAAAPATGSDGAAVSQSSAAAANRNRLIILPPQRVHQGETVVVRVKVPYRGRLTLRTYGARGALVAVGKGRPVVKGWRKVKLTIGPHTRLGTLRILATHVRPQTHAVLTAANVTTVVRATRR